MKKVIAIMILLVITLTLFSPLRIVYADVNINDNDEDILNENQMTIGRRIAMLDVLENLISNGVSEFTISNTNDIDSYLDNLWNEIDDAYNNNTIVPEIIGNVIDWNGLSKLHYEIEKNTLGYATQFNLLGWSLIGIDTLSDFFTNNNFKDNKKNIPVALTGMQFLSNITHELPNPNPDPDFSFLLNSGYLYNKWTEFVQDTSLRWDFTSNNYQITENFIRNGVTYFSPQGRMRHNGFGDVTVWTYDLLVFDNVLTIYYDTNTMQARYVGAEPNSGPLISAGGVTYNGNYLSGGQLTWNGQYNAMRFSGVSTESFTGRTDFSGASTSVAMNYFNAYFCNFNLYVDGEPWVIVNTAANSPNLDIDGILKLFGQNQPVEYVFPNDIEIDYDKLYEVILRAIQNGTPVSMDTINNNNTYYDSHNTVYSPTIYNYYNDNSEDEKDYIDTLISSATVPNFNQTYLIPLTAPLDNGFKVLYVGVSWIPEEILIIFGGLFVLLLFVAILNRMLE